MIIKSIKLINFRSHDEYELDCKNNTTLILGDNGTGKTSVLEAIYIAMRGKSFRSVDCDILKYNRDFYKIELNYNSGKRIIVTFDGKEKIFTNIDKKTKRLIKKDKYPIVLFLPSDLNLINTTPGKRRDYFDQFLGQLDEQYYNFLSKYKKALKQRNQLLKKKSLTKQEVFPWNILLVKYGIEISQLRISFIDYINKYLTETYKSIADNQDQIEINLNTQIKGLNENQYLKKMEENFNRDIRLGYTEFGVHRDDFIFQFNKKIADGSASRGEIRSIILALKFIEVKIINERLKIQPIVLLDDVFSELDEKRQKYLVKKFKNHQVIITSVKGI